MDLGPINERLDRMIDILTRAVTKKATTKATDKRTLPDECDEIVRSARRTEELTRSGVGPTTFHAALREYSPAYAEFSAQADTARKFEEDARTAGRAMQERFKPKPRVCLDAAAPVKAHDSDESSDFVTLAAAARRRLLGR